jgi:ubiquinone/menaquinone biosynthesis C-methylase UbiE
MAQLSVEAQGQESTVQAEGAWAVRLFEKSVLKQRKFHELVAMLGDTTGLRCLDIGADNGVISLLLRQRGGEWSSGDLDETSVQAIKGLVKSEVYQLDRGQTPFPAETFDRVVIADYLEHIPDDAGFLKELYRILKPGGELIVNVPHLKPGFLRRLRLALGQTDEKHGHLRPGYTVNQLQSLFGEQFSMVRHKTYSKFFSELVDTMIVQVVYLAQGHKAGGEAVKNRPTSDSRSSKGAIVTGQDLLKYRKMFRLYAMIYPVVWLFAQVDRLLFWSSGYMLMVKGRRAG